MDKPNLLILHGALGNCNQMQTLKERLSENFEVYCFNFSGHGGKTMPDEFKLKDFSEELVDYIRSEKLLEVYVFGYSMGGYVALYTALNHSGWIKQLVTLGTKMKWTPEIAAQEIKMLDAEKIESKVPKFAAALAKRHQPNNWKEVLQKTADFMVDLGNTSALKIEDFSKITIPITIGIGSEDTMVSIGESEEVVDVLPKGKIEIHEGFKHPIEQIDIEKMSQSLVRFFNV